MKERSKRYSVGRQTAMLVEAYDMLASFQEKTMNALTDGI